MIRPAGQLGQVESWPALGPAAYHGLAGEVVSRLDPHTESDPAGVLLTFLAAFGAAVGGEAHALADGSRHPARLNVVLVGKSSRARKGTSWSVTRRVLEKADPPFFRSHVLSGLSSGEGLVAALAAATEAEVVTGLEGSLLVVEPEFARLLRVAGRPGATLSAVVREAWDGDELRVLTRSAPLRATGVHVAVVGHVTIAELRRRLNETETTNGLANRFMWACVRRSKKLPAGGNLSNEELEELGARVGRALSTARRIGRLTRTPRAEQLWARLYRDIDDEVDGVIGALTARAEAQLLRLSVVYALLDGSETIRSRHLLAAEAVWDYCAQSVEHVFADGAADPVVERLLVALQNAGAEGLDGTEQRDLFNRHLPGRRLVAARRDLERRGVVSTTTVETGGRPRLVTTLIAHGDAGGQRRSLSSLRSPPSSQREQTTPSGRRNRYDPLTSDVTEPVGKLTGGRA